MEWKGRDAEIRLGRQCGVGVGVGRMEGGMEEGRNVKRERGREGERDGKEKCKIGRVVYEQNIVWENISSRAYSLHAEMCYSSLPLGSPWHVNVRD